MTPTFLTRLERARPLLSGLNADLRHEAARALTEPVNLDALAGVGPVFESLVALSRAEGIPADDVAAAVLPVLAP